MSPLDALLVLYFMTAFGLSFVVAWLTSRRAMARGRGPWRWAGLGLLFGVLALAAVAVLPSRAADDV